jgi:uncharacterized protein (DUF433 family)
MAGVTTYVHEDEQRALRVGAAGVSLDSIVLAFQDGFPAETIQQQYPALSLEEVYGAITYYLANRDTVHRYLEQQAQRWQDVRQKIEQARSPVVERLRALRKAASHERS